MNMYGLDGRSSVLWFRSGYSVCWSTCDDGIGFECV